MVLHKSGVQAACRIVIPTVAGGAGAPDPPDRSGQDAAVVDRGIAQDWQFGATVRRVTLGSFKEHRRPGRARPVEVMADVAIGRRSLGDEPVNLGLGTL